MDFSILPFLHEIGGTISSSPERQCSSSGRKITSIAGASRGGSLVVASSRSRRAGNSHMLGTAPTGENPHGAAELSRKPSNYLGSWVSQAHSGINDNARPNFSLQPTLRYVGTWRPRAAERMIR